MFAQSLLRNTYSKMQLARPHSAAANSKGRIEKSVFISQSKDLYTNLALEEWLHRNQDFKKHHVMLFYKNDSCFNFGKEESWLDTEQEVGASKKNSDDGTVNLTFFAEKIDRNYNLGIIARGIFRKYGLTLRPNDDHLTFYNKKLCNASSKMGQDNPSSQNCSLFLDVNKNAMDMVTGRNKKDNFLNLKEIDPKICESGLLSSIGWEYLRTTPFVLKDGGENLASQQRGFQMINPSEDWFPGISEIREEIKNSDLNLNETSKFTIFRSFPVPKELLSKGMADSNEVQVKLEVEHGKIRDICLVVPPGLLLSGYSGEAKIVTELKGQLFTEETLGIIENILGLEKGHNEQDKLVTECVKKAMAV